METAQISSRGRQASPAVKVRPPQQGHPAARVQIRAALEARMIVAIANVYLQANRQTPAPLFSRVTNLRRIRQ